MWKTSPAEMPDASHTVADKTPAEKLRGRIPLVIGVTGHRDLRPEDERLLRDEVVKVFDEIRCRYLKGSPNGRLDDLDTPVILLSALAEGADRLVTEVALQQGAILIAPLPMEENEYRADFRPPMALHPNAEAEFDRLLGQAFARIEMPYRAGSARALIQTDENRRAEQYQDVGLYIASHCHVLIALWNGDAADRKPGGTAEVVSFKRDGIPMALSRSMRTALDGSEIGPVIHVVTPRAKPNSRQVTIATGAWGTALTGEPGHLQQFLKSASEFALKTIGRVPHEEPNDVRTWRVFEALVQQTCRFNTEATERLNQPDESFNPGQSLAWLFEDTKRQAVSGAQPQAQQAAPYWCDLYKLADALAQVQQRKFMRDWQLLFGAGFLAIVVFEVFAHLYPKRWELLLLYALIFSVVFYWFYHAREQEHQERFLDYRALAEALRVAVYWKLAGITEPIAPSIAEAYPIKQQSELAWVKIVLRTLDMLHSVTASQPVPVTPGSLAMVRELWINGQKAYFERQGNRHHRIAEMREAQSLVLLGLSPFIGVILMLLMARHLVGHDVQHWLIVAMGTAGGAAAVIAGYVEKLAHHAHARQYDRMRMLFAQASTLIGQTVGAAPITPKTLDDVVKLYVLLGEEAMKENAEWVAIYRQRPIRPAG